MFKFLKNFIEKNGIIKIIIAFFLVIISLLISKNTASLLVLKICNIILGISASYIVLIILILIIVGIVNGIKDIFQK